jgi:hypothetical protein
MRYTELLLEDVGTSFGQHIKSLQSKQAQMSTDDPRRTFIQHVLDTANEILNSGAEVQMEAVEPAPSELTSPSAQVAPQPMNMPAAQPTVAPAPRKKQPAPSSNFVHVESAAAAIIDAKVKLFLAQNPEHADAMQEFMIFAEEADTQIDVRKNVAVKKAITAAVKGIELNAKGEIAKLDADIESSALELAKRFGLKRIWARNLVGMFSTKIDRKDREAFLKACSQGNAIDIQSMLKKGSGHLNDVVNTKLPTIANVFKDVKNTLLDISLSTGQRGATGPFEAVLAIMGGAKKPAANEGGDVVFEVGGKRLKFEVKGGSLTPNTNIIKKTGELSNTGGESSAWLDSTANPDPTKKGGELGGSVLRSVGDEWLFKNVPNWQKLGSDLWYKSDFRSSSLGNLNTFLKALEKRKPGSAMALITYMMSKMFPSATTAPGFNFKNSVKKILEAITANDARAVAKEQGTMALIEYALGKGNDGFMFFNSSTQEYKTLVGMKDILAVYKSKEGDEDESAIRFMEPMTMARGKPKCSPSVYYGPAAKSHRDKNYFTEFNKSPERVKLYQQMMNAPDPGGAWEADQGMPAPEPSIRRRTA